jgi:hypothetical protein
VFLEKGSQNAGLEHILLERTCVSQSAPHLDRGAA